MATPRPVDLPPRLSEQQRFILAVLCKADHGKNIGRVSWAVANEFDTNGNRIHDRDASREELLNDADDPGEANLFSSLLRTIHADLDDRALTSMHSASFSRALDRLEQRDLVTRGRSVTVRAYESERTEAARTTWVSPTDQGREAGREVRRRHDDGRYSLTFETLTE